MGDNLIVNKPTFNTELLSPGTPIKISVQRGQTPFGYMDYPQEFTGVITKTDKLRLTVECYIDRDDFESGMRTERLEISDRDKFEIKILTPKGDDDIGL